MGKMEYTVNSAFERVVRNGRTKMGNDDLMRTLWVERGSVGNRVLGAVDYLNKHGQTTVICDKLPK